MGSPFGTNRIEMPPSSVSGELGVWLQRLVLAVNNIPAMSYTSYASPESNETGAPGTLKVNVASDSATSRLWVKQSGAGNTGWLALGTSSAASGAVNSVSGTTHRIDATPTTGAVVVNISPDYDSKISAPVTSVSARTGAVTLTAADIGAGTFPGSAYTVTNTLSVSKTLGVGVQAIPSDAIGVVSSLSGAGAQTGINLAIIYGPDATVSGTDWYSQPSTKASSFTMANLYHVRVADAGVGAGSAVLTQYGLYMNSLSAAGTNYAIYTNTGPVHFGDDVDLASGKLYRINGVQHTHTAADVAAGTFPGSKYTFASAVSMGILVADTGTFNGHVAVGGAIDPVVGLYERSAITTSGGIGIGVDIAGSVTATDNGAGMYGLLVPPLLSAGTYTGNFGFGLAVRPSSNIGSGGNWASVTGIEVLLQASSMATATSMYGLDIGSVVSGVNNFAIRTSLGSVFFGDHVTLGTGKVLIAGGNQVVSARTTAVSDVSGGVVVDVESRAAVNALLADLRWHGLIS